MTDEQPTEHCGSTDPSPSHSPHHFMRGRGVYRCPGGATDQPQPVCKFEQGCHLVVPCEPGCGAARPVPEQTGRHTADTITDTALDELYAEIIEYRNALNWQTDCLGCSRVLDSVYRETMRAEQAEAANARVRALTEPVANRPLPVGYDNFEQALKDFATELLAALDEPAP